jgi:2-methylcitrate dehydratase PrpD
MSGEGLRALAGFAAGTDVRDLPPEVVEKAKACLLYAMAVGIACMRANQPAQAARAIADGRAGNATRFFDDEKCDPGVAAFANGTLFHSRVQDDAHPAGHVGVVVNPAALAMAEAQDADGVDVLAALVAGYETALRIGRDHATDMSARGFRTTPIYGVFGAAAAAGRLLHLDQARMTHALSLAANMPGGLREYSVAGSEDFAFQAGTASQNGILAARLAAAGAASTPSALDGNAGFFRAYGEPGRPYEARLATDLGKVFEMMGVTFKPYPICQFHRGIVRGCSVLRKRAGAASLAALTISMHPFEADFFGVRFAGPFVTFPQTFMSGPFCAALAWARGDATLAGLTDYRAADVLALVPRIGIVADPGRQRYQPRLEARLSDDAVLEWEERDGADAYVLTWDRSCRMASALAAEVGVLPAKVERLVAAVRGLDTARSIAPMLGAMRDACHSASLSPSMAQLTTTNDTGV